MGSELQGLEEGEWGVKMADSGGLELWSFSVPMTSMAFAAHCSSWGLHGTSCRLHGTLCLGGLQWGSIGFGPDFMGGSNGLHSTPIPMDGVAPSTLLPGTLGEVRGEAMVQPSFD